MSDTKYDIDPALTGLWRIQSWQGGPSGRVISSFSGRRDEIVEFTANGRYIFRHDLIDKSDRPSKHRYHVRAGEGNGAMDLVRVNPPSIGRAIYRLLGANLELCIAADDGSRPTSFQASEASVLVLMTGITGCDAPKPKRQRTPVQPLTEPGSFIPTAWLRKPPRDKTADGT